jgi:hypothetical protein
LKPRVGSDEAVPAIFFEFDAHGEMHPESSKRLDYIVSEALRQKANVKYVIVPAVGVDRALAKRVRDELMRRGIPEAHTRVAEAEPPGPGASSNSVSLKFEPLEP